MVDAPSSRESLANWSVRIKQYVVYHTVLKGEAPYYWVIQYPPIPLHQG